MDENRELALKLFTRFNVTMNPSKNSFLKETIKYRCYNDIFYALKGYENKVLSVANKNVTLLENRWIIKWGIFLKKSKEWFYLNELYKIVVKKDDPDLAFEYALEWAYKIGNIKEMSEIVIDSGNQEVAREWISISILLINSDKRMEDLALC